MPTRTELVWDGKYDANGKRVAPLKVALPFQAVETVNEPAGERKTLWSMLEAEKPWRNRLVWGDKKYVLPSLLPEFAGTVNLIYIDPPFDTGADFSFTATVPEAPDDDGGEVVSFTKQPSVIEQKAYRDTWGRGIDSYLQWFYETVVVLHELLHETGTLYIHLDYHVCHYAKCVLDEVFTAEGFANEIVWKRSHAHNSSLGFGPNHDVIYRYTKSPDATWNQVYQAYDPEYVDKQYRHIDESGRRYKHENPTGAGVRNGATGMPWHGINPTKKGRHWVCAPAKLDAMDAQGLIYWPKREGAWPYIKVYLDDMKGSNRSRPGGHE